MASKDDATVRSIQKMPADSARRIVAGQAISDLASAVKELVDNALDSGAKSINIRLFDRGLGIVEVSDDGCGVPIESRSSIAVPNATSKISQFEDIYETLPTLGFRGEALYSLANLSEKLVVATRTKTDACAQKMEFRHDGERIEESIAEMPRKIGTTVAVVGLLKAIPVRRRDFEQRIQQHRSKLVQLMTGYAIFCTGVRVNLMDMLPSGREKVILCTAFSSTTLNDTVASTLGTKVLGSMTEVSIDLSDVYKLTSSSVPEPINSSPTSSCSWKVEGLLSNASIPREKCKGQYFSINRRPVELPKVARLLNTCFRSFGSDRPPLCVLEFTLPGNAFDINLSPDKRQVLLTAESEICAAIKNVVVDLWSTQTEGRFKHNDSLAQGIESVDEAQQKHSVSLTAIAPSTAETADVSSNNRLFHRRRYGFVNDPTTAAAKEQHDGQRRLEYEISSPGGTRTRKRREDWDYKYTEFKAPSLGSDSDREISVRKQTADSYDRDQEDLSCTERNRKRLRGSMAVDTSSTTFSNSNSISVTPSPSNVSNDTSQNRGFVSDFDKCVTVDPLCPSTAPETPSTHRLESRLASSDSERLQWQDAQTRFNRRKVPEHDEVLDSVGADVLAADFSDSRITAHGKRLHSSKLERFGFGHAKNLTDDTRQRPLKALRNTQQSRAVTLDHSSNDTAVRESILAEEQAQSEPESSTKTSNRRVNDPQLHAHDSQPVWKSFKGTEEIIRASMRDRISAHDRSRSQKSLPEHKNIDKSTEKHSAKASDLAEVRLSKEDFRNMAIIGQFNLGFILARSIEGNVWILDQHACDEIKNFEKLFTETSIHEQRLINPMPLELSLIEEACVLDHLEVFEKNGFRFIHDESKPPRHRLSLTALPHSGARDGRKSVTYGKDDVSALCAILSADDDSPDFESGGTGVDGTGLYGNNAVRRYATGNRKGETADRIIARLPKTIAMFASRACRGSIMIGKGLSTKEMEKIVKRLAEIDQPWNCPHGRPTMRHVGDLRCLLETDDEVAKEHIAGPTGTITVLSQEAESLRQA